MHFIQNIDYMQLLRCFVVGGLICIIGQILIDKTKLTPARILVTFVTAGAILGGLGIYKYITRCPAALRSRFITAPPSSSWHILSL